MCVGRFFAVIVNIYIPGLEVRASVNIRDKTLEALNDSHYVAPLVETGDYYSSLNARSWFYVFDYQTKNSYYKQVCFTYEQNQVSVFFHVLVYISYGLGLSSLSS